MATEEPVELNKDMYEEIDEIEKEMIAVKSWELKGEVSAKQRPMNSLIAEHLDFQLQIPKSEAFNKKVNNNQIETMIKSRVLDELFDDPIRKTREQPKQRVLAEDLMDYEQSKKGLADLYEHDFKVQHLGYSAHPEEDAAKEEIDSLLIDLFYKLDSLSNAHFTPKPIQPEAKITTQNVSAIMIEDKTPVIVSEAQTKSAKEIYTKDINDLADKDELSKEEKRAARLRRKRKIRVHLHQKQVQQKEKRRKMDMAMNEKFEARYNNKKKMSKEDKVESKNAHKSNKFFEKMQDISTKDDDKKKSKQNARGVLNNNERSKTFKL